MKKTTLTPAEFKSRMNALYEESCRELLRTQDFHTALESLRPVKNIITTM